MSLVAFVIFIFCSWAVFSKHFCDGIITKHFLAFSAITAVLVMLDPKNYIAFYSSAGLLLLGIGYWLYKHRKQFEAMLRIIEE